MERFVIGFSTSSDPSVTQEEAALELLSKYPFRHRSSSEAKWQDSPDISRFDESDESIMSLSDWIHCALDDLPDKMSYCLDIVWIRGSASKLPVRLFGALKRSFEWHGAAVRVGGSPFVEGDCLLPFLKYSRFASKHLEPSFWRGSLAFYEDEFMGLKSPSQTLNGFSLRAWNSPCTPDILSSSRTLSRSLKVVSAAVNLFDVPRSYFKDRLTLSYESSEEEDVFEYIRRTYLGSSSAGLLLRLEYSKNQVDLKNNLTTANWFKSVHSDNFDPGDAVRDYLGKHSESIVIAAIGGSKTLELDCWILNPEGSHPFEGFHYPSVSHPIPLSDVPFDEFPRETHVPRLIEYIKESERQISDLLRAEDPRLFKDDKLEETLATIRCRVINRLQLTMNKREPLSLIGPAINVETSEEREERRFLKFLSEQKNMKEEAEARRSARGSHYVIWDPKELIKFFNKDGTAKSKDESTEILQSHNKRACSFQENSSWPEVLSIGDALGVEYNRGDASEARDRKIIESQRLHIGIKETYSTGTAKTSNAPDVIPVVATKKASPTQKKKEPIRSSPRKKVKTPPYASKEDIFKQKLRNAVFNALNSRSIDVDNELFRPCFKKLFSICKMYAGSKPPVGQGSTKEWLNKVALQNVGPVVTLEKTLQSAD